MKENQSAGPQNGELDEAVGTTLQRWLWLAGLPLAALLAAAALVRFALQKDWFLGVPTLALLGALTASALRLIVVRILVIAPGVITVRGRGETVELQPADVESYASGFMRLAGSTQLTVHLSGSAPRWKGRTLVAFSDSTNGLLSHLRSWRQAQT
ncbi:MAG TPA: hypothetical protein VGK50_04460 [Coriobacteriia bacterium]|jgi:hypothetical protein